MAEVQTKVFVEFQRVQKSYDGEILVVKNLNLDIERGEFVTMLGPSGSGKTTCLMMLAGFEPATHCEIYLGDRPINAVPPHKRGIGMVFQNYALFPHMTVNENLAFPLEVRKLSKSEIATRTKRALDMVQLGAFGDRRPAQLSGGQQQRVAVARALAGEPDTLLLDEPTSALDVSVQAEILNLLTDLRNEHNLTYLMVSHDLPVIGHMCDRLAVMKDGEIVEVMETDDLRHGTAKHDYSRSLLAASAVA